MNIAKYIPVWLSLFMGFSLYAQNDTILYQNDTSAPEIFGESLVISYPWLIAGNQEQYQESGRAYAFQFVNQKWEQKHILAPTSANDHWFGLSIATDSSQVIIGSPGGGSTGSAYIYNIRQDSSWKTFQRIVPSDGALYDGFGISVDISAEFAIVSSFSDDDLGPESGSAYIFKYQNKQWIQQAKLLASDGVQDDHFGVTVAIEDTIAVIGASDKSTIFGQYSGQAYVFTYHDSVWIQRDILLPNDLVDFDFFGDKVAISNHRIMVSASAQGLTGTVYSFIYDGSNWTLEQKITPNATNLFNAQFGSSLFLDANRLLVGTPFLTISNINVGGAFLFEYNGNQWIQKQSFAASNAPNYGQFGKSVGFDGRFIAIGRIFNFINYNDPGEVHVWQICGPGHINQEPKDPVCKEQIITFYSGCATDSVNWYNLNGLLLANSHYLQQPAIDQDTIWAEYWSTSGFYGITGYDTVIIKIEPKAGFSTDTVCLGQPTHFTDLTQMSTPYRYAWDFNNDGVVDDSTQGNTSFTYPAAGSYLAKLLVQNMEGCRDSVYLNVQVGCTGMNKVKAISKLRVYLNPANKELNISWVTTRQTRARLEVTDVLGRMVYSQNLQPGEHDMTLNISSWPVGVYLLRMVSISSVVSISWLKE